MNRFLARVSEWSVTHPAQTIAGVISLVAIIGIVGALRLTPDAGTEKLVNTGSSAYEGTEEFRERFGDDAIVVLARGDLKKLVLTEELGQLLALEGCLSGNQPPEGGRYPASICRDIETLDATKVVFGPATFLNQAATQAATFIEEQFQETLAAGQRAARRAARQAAQQGLGPADQQAAAQAAQQGVVAEAMEEFRDLAVQAGEFGLPRVDNPEFISAIVFDSAQPSGTPKAKWPYLFPSANGALISVRLEPDLDDATKREAISLIRQAVHDDAFALSEGSYEISGVPVVVEGLADLLAGQILLLLGVALVVMALTLMAIFGPPLRLLPVFIALAASAVAFGLLSLVGGSLTMASVAVLPVVIGLGVDYGIQLQARFREAQGEGRRAPAAAVAAAIRGGPVIGVAALATGAGFLVLILSPIPMVREFAFALVVGIGAAYAISLTAGLAALSLVVSRVEVGAEPGSSPDPTSPRAGAASESLRRAGSRITSLARSARALAGRGARTTLATAIASPGRVLLVAVLLAGTGWAAGARTEVVSDIRALVPADIEALQAASEVEEEAGASGELNVLVKGDDVTSPEAVAWMGEFRQRVLSQHGFTGELPSCRTEGTELCPGPALPDLFGSDSPEPGPNRIESVLAVVPEYFSQAIISRPEGEQEVSNISFLIPVMPLDRQEALIDEIRAELDPPPGISAEVVGLPVLAADASADLSGSRYWLTFAGLLAVSIVLLAVYRNAGRALVPLIPIALATGWSALVLAAMDVQLNPMSATLGALVIAVTTEFSVILSSRYHEERAAGRAVGEALRMTYARAGTAVLASGLTSIAGFGVLIASKITMLREFGLVTVVDLTVSIAGVMLVLPAALVWAEGGFRPLPALGRRVRSSPARELGEPGAAG